MVIRFRCGHTLEVTRTDAPRCPTCGETTVVAVLQPRRPTFTGSVRQPKDTHAD